MKGIILAGGAGTRLYPLTMVTSKQLLPVYDKPMIFYPLSTLMLAGIKEILIISTPVDLPNFERLLGDGSQFGIQEKLKSAVNNAENGYATVFGYYVNDPERFGIMEFNEDGRILSVEEKPKYPKSNYCVTGLYFYDKRVVSFAKDVKPSARGELEITSLNNLYLKDGALKGIILGRGFAWLDTGTMDSLIEASEFVQMTEKRQGVKISAPEEIAFRNGWIDKETLMTSALRYGKSPYGQHLKNVAEGKFIY